MTTSDLKRMREGARLLAAGVITPFGALAVYVRDPKRERGHVVTSAGCHCHVYKITLKRQALCIHMWAAQGYFAAKLYNLIENAECLGDIESAFRDYKEMFASLHESYRHLILKFSSTRSCEITANWRAQHGCREKAESPHIEIYRLHRVTVGDHRAILMC